MAAGRYEGPVRPAVVAFKERGRAELARPLGTALALAVAAVLSGAGELPGPVLLVPVPSSAAAVRTRGRDHVRELTGRALTELRAAGVPAAEARLLRRAGRVRDSAGLSAAERRANLAGTFRLAAAPPAGAALVLVDDVVTSGATLTAAASVLGRALRVGALAGARGGRRRRRPARRLSRSTVGTCRCPTSVECDHARSHREVCMEIVVHGRNVEVPEHFRQHVWDKVSASDRFDGKLKILRVDVELFHEKNPRQSANCQRVEITLRGKGPVVRAEACAPDFYSALDLAAGKLDTRHAPRGRPPPGAPRPPDAGERAAAGQHRLGRAGRGDPRPRPPARRGAALDRPRRAPARAGRAREAPPRRRP